MLFDRRKKTQDSPANARAEYRYPLPENHPLRMVIVRSDGSEVETRLVDLTARGAGFRAWPDLDLGADEAVDVIIENGEDGWSVRTPAMARHWVGEGDANSWGVEFINLGNLYGQWDNLLGKYFNRRSERRVTPELDRAVGATITVGERTISASIHDLSPHGVGLAVRHTEVTGIEREQRIELEFKLPRSRRTLRGSGIVRRNSQVGALGLIGLEFDLEEPGGFGEHERSLVQYCKKRAKALSEWEQSWQSDAA